MSAIQKNARVATIAILGSRILGLLREQVFAVVFGAGWVWDSYVAAFRIPNLLRDLFAEGALSQSFVTIFSQKTAAGETRQASNLANKLMTLLALVLGIIVAIGIVLAPHIVGIIAQGFVGEKFTLTVLLTRILFPFILFVSLAALLMGMLNARGKFFLPQSASTFFNLTSIVAGLAIATWTAPDYMIHVWGKIAGNPTSPPAADGMVRAIIGMTWGTLLGGLVQWLIQVPALLKMGYRPRVDLKFKDPDLARVLRLTGPAVIGAASVQVNVMVNTFFASSLPDGSIASLNCAFRLMQFPLGVFGVAVAVASAPVLARLIAQPQGAQFRQTLAESLRMSAYLSIPSAVGLIVLAEPIIQLIYQYGHFTALDTSRTAAALSAYAVGIAAYSFIKIYQPAYLAHHDARTPMLVALFSIVLNALVNWFFIRVLGLAHWSLALGTAIVATTDCLLLGFLFRGRARGLWNREMLDAISKITMAAAVMAVATWLTHTSLVPHAGGTDLPSRLTLVIAPMVIAALVYGGATWLLGMDEARALATRLKRLWKRNRSS